MEARNFVHRPLMVPLNVLTFLSELSPSSNGLNRVTEEAGQRKLLQRLEDLMHTHRVRSRCVYIVERQMYRQSFHSELPFHGRSLVFNLRCVWYGRKETTYVVVLRATMAKVRPKLDELQQQHEQVSEAFTRLTRPAVTAIKAFRTEDTQMDVDIQVRIFLYLGSGRRSDVQRKMNPRRPGHISLEHDVELCRDIGRCQTFINDFSGLGTDLAARS